MKSLCTNCTTEGKCKTRQIPCSTPMLLCFTSQIEKLTEKKLCSTNCIKIIGIHQLEAFQKSFPFSQTTLDALKIIYTGSTVANLQIQGLLHV